MTSEANLDTARAKQETAQAAVKRIEAVIAQKAIAAPFGGRVGIRKVEKGQYVSAGMALVSLQALDPIRADFPMPEQHIGKLRVGQPIELTVDAFPGQVFKGEIQSLDARVAQDTRTLLVRGDPPQQGAQAAAGHVRQRDGSGGRGGRRRHRAPDGGHLQPLRRQRLRGEAGARPKEGAAPPAAAGQPASEQLIAERRFVRTGQVREDRVAITFGLTAGEQVVTTGQLKLNPGAAIHIDNTQPLNRPETRPKL